MRPIGKLIPTLLYVMLSVALFSGCRDLDDAQHNHTPHFTSYRDIPGITDEEINAIEALRQRHNEFSYAMMFSTEAFVGEDGEIHGYAARMCEWLTELFGIPFVPQLYSWTDLNRGINDQTINFTGNLMPTEERQGLYYITDAITQRPVKYFRLADSEPLTEIGKTRTVRYALVRGSSTTDSILAYATEIFEPVLVDEHIEAYELLKTGEVDALVSTGIAEAVFDEFGDVVSKDFIPLIYSTTAMATNNPELKPIIDAVQKALQHGAGHYLYELRWQGHWDYMRHKFLMRLTPEEREYIKNNPVIPFAAEFDNYPVSFYDFRQKEWQGICFDVLQEIETLTGLKFSIDHEIELSWDDLLQTLENGETKIISELIRTADREGRFLWPENNFLRDHSALISKSDHRNISLHEVWTVRVGLTAGNAHTEFFHRWFPDHKYTVEFADQVSLLEALDRGEIDMVKNRNNLLLYLTNYQERAGYKSNYVFANIFESTFGFNKDADLLCSIVDKALDLVDTKSISDQWLRRTYDYRIKIAEAQKPWMYGMIGSLLCVIGLMTVFYALNTRKRRTIARQAAMLTAIYDSIPGMVFTKDLNNRYTSCNSKFEDEAKLNASQLVGKDFQDIEIHNEDYVQEFAEANQKVLKERMTLTTEAWYGYTNNVRKAKQIIRTPLIQQDEVVGLLGIVLDITERKLAEEAASESSARTKVMLDTIPICCCLINRKYECIDCNDEAVRLFELNSKQEFIDNFAHFSPEHQPDGSPSIETVCKIIDRAFEGEPFTGEWTHNLLDGTLIPAVTTFERVKYGDDYVVFSYARDRREHKRLATRVEAIIDNLPGMVFQQLYDPPGYTYTFVSQGCEELLGYAKEELLGNGMVKFFDMVHPDDIEGIEQLSAATIPYGLPFDIIFRMTMKDGTEKRIWERSRVIEKNPDGSPRLVEGYYSDVTERWKLEAAELEQKRMASRVEAMLDNLPGMIFQCLYNPPDYTYTFVSKGCETLTGYTAEELLSNPMIQLVHPDDLSIVAEQDAASFPFGLPFEAIFRIITKDGEEKWIWERSRIVETNADGTPTLIEGYYSDVSERWKLKTAEQEQLRMSKRIETMINNVPGMVFQGWHTLPDEYVYTFVSAGCEPLLGYTAEELLGENALNFGSIIHPEDVSAMEEMSRSIAQGIPYEGTFRVITKDGTEKWLWERCRVLETGQDGVSFFVEGYYADVTERWKLEAAEQEQLRMSKRIETMIANLPGMVFQCLATFPDYPLTYVSEGSRELLGYSPEELVGGPNKYMEMLHPEDFEIYKKKVTETLDVGLPFTHTGRFILKDGSTKWILESCRVSETNPDGTPYLLDGYCVDMSEQHRRQEAEAASRTKSEFLAVMSHEIRTPMNSIMGFAELALDIADDTRTKDYLEKITESTKWLLYIINDILDISKIESGKLELERVPFNLSEIVSRCQSVILPSIKDKELELRVYVEPRPGKKLVGDPVRLYQVLMNLLSNAVKFTSFGVVKFSSLIREATDTTTTVYFEVCDSGIGMTPEQIGKLYEPFMQADSSTTRKYGGTGLGLAITKNILEMMGGNLKVESTPDVGSTFSFEIVFETVEDTDDTSERPRFVVVERPLFEGVVLICEDNPMNQELICEHLVRVGLELVVAENGKIGLEMVKERMQKGEKPFDLILMDMFMPVMDGIAAAPKIAALNTGTPIVAMTANIMAGELEKYRKHGMPDCLGKPFTAQELWHILLKYLKPVSATAIEEQTQLHDDEALQKKLWINFVKNSQTKHAEIIEAITAGDRELAHRLVHTLKGNAGQIGKTKLQNAAAEVENLLKNRLLSTSEGSLQVLETELTAVLDELAPLLDELASQAVLPPLNTEQTSVLFDTLATMLENINPECVGLLDDLRTVPGTEELAEQIENYDFETAAKTLAELRKNVHE